MWGEDFVADLARDFEVASYDHRGIGGSSRVDAEFSIADLADDAARLLDALGWESAHVLGISMGGMVAQQLCLRAPDRVRSVVLGCTSAGGPSAFSAPGPGRIIEAMGTRDAAVATRVAFEVNVSSDFAQRPGELERFAQISLSRRVPVPVVQLQAMACMAHDTAEGLGDLAAPTLVVHGDEDQMILVGEGQRLAELVPGAELEVWPGVGHLFWWERPSDAADLVRRHALG
jgi:pimeloyl-ACP methyl ester carboxylesterase